MSTWFPHTTHPVTTCVSDWDEDEWRSVEVLGRNKRGDKYHYYTVIMQHWPDTTPKWYTTCSECWNADWPFEWSYIEETV